MTLHNPLSEFHGEPPQAVRRALSEADEFCRERDERDELRVRVQELETELAEAHEQIDTMIEKGIEEGLGIKSLTVEDGAANLSIATTNAIAEHTVLVMLDGLANILDAEDATNYVEFDLRRRGKSPVSVCVRRYAHPTPHELRERAERELESVVNALHELHTRVSGTKSVDECFTCLTEWPCPTIKLIGEKVDDR